MIQTPDRTLRIALVGLSSPIAYQYDAAKFQPFGADYNPILPNSTALMTLFDEIWFAHKALCPIDMRERDYVRFLHEAPWARGAIQNAHAGLQATMTLFDDIHSQHDKRALEFPQLVKASQLVSDGKKAIDNHSRSFALAGKRATGDSVSASNFCFDTLLEDHLRREGYGNVQLITHPTSEQFFPAFKLPDTLEFKVTHELIVRRIPNWQSDFGPCHPIHAELRARSSVREYRHMIRAKSASHADAVALAKEVEREFLDVTLRADNDGPVYMDALRSAVIVLGGFGGWMGTIPPEVAALLAAILELPKLRALRGKQAVANAKRKVSFLGDLEVISRSPVGAVEDRTVHPTAANTLTTAEILTRLGSSKEKIRRWASHAHPGATWGADNVDGKWKWKLLAIDNQVILEFSSDDELMEFADQDLGTAGRR